jgi:hypothetical protein
VLAAQPEQTIGLDSILPGELCTAIVDVLPELAAGPGYGISLPASTLSGDPVSGTAAAQLEEVRAIQARPVYAAGQFGVSRRSAGRVVRVGGLTWFDTDVGAYCATKTPGRGGQEWVTVTPVDSTRLAARVAALLNPED